MGHAGHDTETKSLLFLAFRNGATTSILIDKSSYTSSVGLLLLITYLAESLSVSC